ncbi:hypothetical protein SNK03_006027 [Fusarium graminearum]
MTIEEANYTTKKYLFIIEHLYAFTLFFAKISILSFYWRMFRVANIQFAISILLTCSILWIIVRGVRSWSRYRYCIYPLQQQVTGHDISTGSRHHMGFSGGKPCDNIQ